MKYLLQIILFLGLSLNLLADDAQNQSLIKIEKEIEEKHFESATQLLTDLDAQTAASAEAAYLQGRLKFEQGKFEEAIPIYEKAITADDQVAKYFAAIGTSRIMLANQGNPMITYPMILKAIENYNHALVLDPDQVEAHIGLARFYSNAPAIVGGSMPRAREHADAILKSIPRLAYIEHAEISKKEKDFAKAAGYFEKAIQNATSPKPMLHYLKGDAYQKSNDIEQAKAAYEAALKIDPELKQAKTALESLSQ